MRRLAYLVAALLLATVFWGQKAFAVTPAGAKVAAGVFTQAASLSRGRALDLSGETLVLSNSPEFPDQPGILVKVDNVLSATGRFRLLYSHENLLFDLSNPGVDDPATIGFAVVNHTGRPVSLAWTRFATARTTDEKGVRAGPADYAPQPAGAPVPAVDFGGREGAALVEKWFASGDGREHWLADLPPGGSYLYSENVGPESWAMGLADFVLRDAETGRLVTGEAGAVGVEVLVTRYGTGFASFYRLANELNLVLPADDTRDPPTPFHQRGIFSGADRSMTIRYDPAHGPVTVQVAQQSFAQNSDRLAPLGYQPEMFVNDVTKNGRDDHPAVRAEDSGDYGVQYVFRLRSSGPAVITVQPAVTGGAAPVDMYDQHLVLDLDGEVRTVSFRDPGYAGYYRLRAAIRPLGWGRVVFVLPYDGRTHVLRTSLPPNGYGPYRIMIIPGG